MADINARRLEREEQQKRRRIITIVIAGAVVLALLGGAFCFFFFRQYKEYKTAATIPITNPEENTKFIEYESGYLKCAGDGLTYFSKKGINWNEIFEMTKPLMDTAGELIAVADMKSSDILLFNVGGAMTRFSAQHSITAIQISNQGVVAVATNDDMTNYIEVYDRNGNELITAKTIFANSGYLMDIALSDDGTKLAAAYVSVGEGTLGSKVVFYDFATGGTGQNLVIGGFNEFSGTVITDVEFMSGNRVAAIGDNSLTIFDAEGTPKIVHEELGLEWQIQSLFFSEDYIGFIVNETNGENNYCIKVFNLNGKQVMDQGFDFAYSRVSFAGRNVALSSTNDFELYSFSGVQRMSYSFDERIVNLVSVDSPSTFIYAMSGSTEIIKLK